MCPINVKTTEKAQMNTEKSAKWVYKEEWQNAVTYTVISRRWGGDLNCIFKIFGFLDIRHLQGTHTVQLPCMYYTLSFLQTKLAENSIVSKISTFYILLYCNDSN